MAIELFISYPVGHLEVLHFCAFWFFSLFLYTREEQQGSRKVVTAYHQLF